MSSKNGLNNKYSEIAPFMSDARLFTEYDPNYETNDRFMVQHNIESNYQYRQYLIQNGMEILNMNRQNACNNTGRCVFHENAFKQRNPEGKYLYKGHSDETKPYGYENSDMKEKYISSSGLQSRLAAPIMNQQDLLKTPRAN